MRTKEENDTLTFIKSSEVFDNSYVSLYRLIRMNLSFYIYHMQRLPNDFKFFTSKFGFYREQFILIIIL